VSKILKNNTASPVNINDVGVTVPALGQILIDAGEYLLYARSSDVVTLVGDSTLTASNGDIDLSIADGIRLIQGNFPTQMSLYPVGVLAIADVVKEMRGATAYDEFNLEMSGNYETLCFKYAGVCQKEIKVEYVSSTVIKVTSVAGKVLQEDGDFILAEDGFNILEEG